MDGVAGCGIETPWALCFRLANVVKELGIVREPRELRDFGESSPASLNIHSAVRLGALFERAWRKGDRTRKVRARTKQLGESASALKSL
jgi:hypothetical protein